MVYQNKEEQNVLPQFRESAYTKIKQEIGEETPETVNIMEHKVEIAAQQALEKRKFFIDYIKNKKF